jgi:hypothetical protein
MIYDIFDQEQEITIPILFGQRIIYIDDVAPISTANRIVEEPSRFEPNIAKQPASVFQKFLRILREGYLTDEEKNSLRKQRAVLP